MNVIEYKGAKYVLRETCQAYDTCKNCAFGTPFGDCTLLQNAELSCVYEAMKQKKRPMYTYFERVDDKNVKIIEYNGAKYVLREARREGDACKNCAFVNSVGECTVCAEDISCITEAMKQNKRSMYAYFVRVNE